MRKVNMLSAQLAFMVLGVFFLHTPEAASVTGCPAAARDCSAVQRQLDHSIDPLISKARYNYTFSIYYSWDIHCDIVIRDQDIGETPYSPIVVKDIGECALHCEVSGRLCQAFTFHLEKANGSGSCYLKTSGAPQYWKLLDDVSITSSTRGLADGQLGPSTSRYQCEEVVTVIKRPKSCVGVDKKVQCRDIPSRLLWYGKANPKDWSVYCNIVVNNHDLGATTSSSGKTRIVSACAQQCANEPKCQAFTFVFGRNETLDSDCFLKTSAEFTDFSLKEGANWDLREKEVRCVQYVTGVKKKDSVMCSNDVKCMTALVLSIIACLKAFIDILLLDQVRRMIKRVLQAVGLNVAADDGEGVSKRQQFLAFFHNCLGHITNAGGKATDTDSQLQRVNKSVIVAAPQPVRHGHTNATNAV